MRWAWAALAPWLALPAAGEPMTFRLEQELDRARYVLEATVVRAPSPAALVELRVDRRPARILRGFGRLGKTLLVRCFAGGTQSMQRSLVARQGQSLLVVIDERLEIRLVAERRKTGYLFRGFYDFNAAWVSFEKRAGETIDVDFLTVGRRFTGRDSTIARAATLLLIAPAERDATAARKLIAGLADPRYRAREAAQRRLQQIAAIHEPLLREELQRTRLLEVRHRLKLLLEEIAPWREASRLAAQATGDRALALHLLRAALPRLPADRRGPAQHRIEQLTRKR